VVAFLCIVFALRETQALRARLPTERFIVLRGADALRDATRAISVLWLLFCYTPFFEKFHRGNIVPDYFRFSVSSHGKNTVKSEFKKVPFSILLIKFYPFRWVAPVPF
jgi:hypothetical protein